MMLTNKYYGETDVFAIGLNGNYQLGDETTTDKRLSGIVSKTE